MSKETEASCGAVAAPVERPVRPLVKWRTGWRHEIERMECTRETAKCVWRLDDFMGTKRESRREKMGTRWQYHDSWDAAHAYLTQQAEQKLVSARRQLELAQAVAGNVKGMRRPQEA